MGIMNISFNPRIEEVKVKETCENIFSFKK